MMELETIKCAEAYNNDQHHHHHNNNHDDNNATSNKKATTTPLPLRKMILISLVAITEISLYTMLPPFVPFMIKDFGIARSSDELGYYVGLLVASISFTNLLTNYLWGRISDYTGRKPALLVGMLSNGICLLAFGLSRNYFIALSARLVNGLFNSNTGTMKAYIYDSTDATNQERAFTIFALVCSLAAVVSPGIGGWLSQPAQKYPNLFSSSPSALFARFPYLLPCALMALFNALVFVLVLIFLKEDEKRERKKSNNTSSSNNNQMTQPTAIKKKAAFIKERVRREALNVLGLLRDSTVLKVIASYACITTIFSGFDEVFPIWASSSVSSGGLGWNSTRIGVVLSISGLFSIVTLAVYPVLARRTSVLRVFQIGLALMIPTAFLMPFAGNLASYLNLVSLQQQQQQQHQHQHQHQSQQPQQQPSSAWWLEVPVWVFVTLCFFVRTCSYEMCFTSNYMLVNNSVTADACGSVNGLAQMVGSVGWLAGPIIGGSLFALSVSDSWARVFPWQLNKNVVFVCVSVVAALSLVLSFTIPKSINQRKATAASTQQQSNYEIDMSQQEAHEEEEEEAQLLQQQQHGAEEEELQESPNPIQNAIIRQNT